MLDEHWRKTKNKKTTTSRSYKIPLTSSLMLLGFLNFVTGSDPSQKNNKKWIKYLNVKCKTVKVLEDNIGENLDFGFCDDFS